MYKERIEEIDQQVKELYSTKRTLMKEWVDAEHPLKIGDRVTVNGYTYRGKTMIVDELYINQGWREWEWIAKGNIIKKDGKPGLQRGKWHKIII